MDERPRNMVVGADEGDIEVLLENMDVVVDGFADASRKAIGCDVVSIGDAND